MGHEIYISREKSGLGHANAAGFIKKSINKALSAEGIDTPCIVSVMLTDDEGIHFDLELCEKDPETGAVMLGDMMISLERCAAQGEELGHGFEREVCYLTVHSVLHLLGYDHVDEGEMKAQMRKREKQIMEDDK